MWKKSRLENNEGFFPIWNDFKEYLSADELSGGAIRLYVFLGLVSDNWTGESWYSVKKISEELACSERTVQNWAKELKEKDLIDRMQKKLDGVAHTYLVPYNYSKTVENKVGTQ